MLHTDAGNYLFESLAIMEFLEETCPEPSMWGKDTESRGLARNLERIADARMLSPSAGYVHAVNSPLGLDPNDAVAKYLQPSFKRGLEYFDKLLGDGRSWLAGDQVTIADCTLQGGLQFMRFRELEDLSEYPNVAQWSTRYRERPAAQSVLIF